MKEFVILLILFSGKMAAAADVCRNTGQMPLGFDNSEIWIEQTKALSIEAVTKDLKGFCEWNRMDRIAAQQIEVQWRGSMPSNLNFGAASNPGRKKFTINDYRTNKDTGDRDQAANILGRGDNLPWPASLSGHPQLKLKADTWFFKIKKCTHSAVCHAKEMVKALSQSDFKGQYDIPEYNPSPPEVSSATVLGGCVYVNVLNSLGCKSATSDLMEFVAKDDGRRVTTTGIPLLKETLSNSRITTALKNVSVQLWKNLENKSFSPKANIFSDLTSELVKQGMPVIDAKRNSLKILGAIATGGPNYADRIKKADVTGFPSSCENSCNLNGVYMAAIAEGMVHADTIKMMSASPSLYTLPANVNFPCDSGKSYHFWLSAALTDALVQKEHSQTSARDAVFASHLGYQLNGSGSRQVELSEVPRFGAVENGMRIDLNLASAGTAFGANLEHSEDQSLDIKEGLLNSIRESSLSAAAVPAVNDFNSHVTNFGKTGLVSYGDMFKWLGRNGPKAAYGSYP